MNVSENRYSPRKYLAISAISFIVLMFCLGMASYLVDPFFQFRVKSDSQYFLNPRFVNGGLAKNYEYNTVVLGSSMVQNYNLSILRKNNDAVKPVKLSTGGMNILEMEYLYSFIKKDEVKACIINIDIPQFNLTSEEVRYPKYLYDNGLMNKLEYLYGYETLIRFTPIDLGLSLYLKNKEDIPLVYKMKTSIDNIGNTSLDGYFSAEHVKELYLNGISVSLQDNNGMKERMHNRLDTMFSRMAFEKHKNIQYTLVLPPYSALYWYHTTKAEYKSQFIDFIYYLNNAVKNYDNVKIAFFFDIDEITDLNNYTDITHFSPVLSDKILENIDNPIYKLNSSNIDSRIQRLDSLTSFFIKENSHWLTK